MEEVSDDSLCEKLDSPCNCKSEISNDFNTVGGHCLQAMKIVHDYANDCFDWLISEQQSFNPSREAISTLSGNWKRFTLVRHVSLEALTTPKCFSFKSVNKKCNDLTSGNK